MARIVRRTEINECRQCATFCDRVIAPASCIADDCPNLYTYDDPLTGRRYMGCLKQVFATRDRRRTVPRRPSGRRSASAPCGSRTPPLQRCRFEVEQAYDGRGLEAYRCVNKRFYDWPDDAPGAIRAFDLRDRCES